MRLQTMWRTDMGARVGLHWTNIITWLRHAEGMGKKKMANTLHTLHAMEAAALTVWAEQREKQTNKPPH